MLRNIYAFLVAPFPAATLMALRVAAWPRPGGGVFEHPASMFVTISLFFYIVGVVLGIPLFLWLRRRGGASLRTCAFTGALITLIGIGLPAAWAVAHGQRAGPEIVFGILIYGVLGLLTGAMFWLIARPDRRAAFRKAGLSKTFE